MCRARLDDVRSLGGMTKYSPEDEVLKTSCMKSLRLWKFPLLEALRMIPMRSMCRLRFIILCASVHVMPRVGITMESRHNVALCLPCWQWTAMVWPRRSVATNARSSVRYSFSREGWWAMEMHTHLAPTGRAQVCEPPSPSSCVIVVFGWAGVLSSWLVTLRPRQVAVARIHVIYRWAGGICSGRVCLLMPPRRICAPLERWKMVEKGWRKGLVLAAWAKSWSSVREVWVACVCCWSLLD